MELSYLIIKIRRIIVRMFWSPINILLGFYFRNIISFKEPPLVILTLGKVGSSSIYRSLKHGYSAKVFHVHSLNIKNLLESRRMVLESDRKSVPFHNLVAYHLANKMKVEGIRPYIIILVREPISRAISEAYQNLDLISDTIEKNDSIDDVAMLSYLKSILNDPDQATMLDSWFDREIFQQFGLDIFKYDRHSGFAVHDLPKARFLVLRMEDLNREFKSAMREFLNTDSEVELLLDNIGNRKWYRESYKSLVEYLKKTESGSLFKETRYYQHFYGD